MLKLRKYLPLAVAVCLLCAVWGEFIICFARGYEELWYTILALCIVVTALAAAGYATKLRWLYFIASVIIFASVALLIGFPSYACYCALVLGAVATVGQAVMAVLYLIDKKSER